MLKVLFTTDAETIAQQLETGGPVARLVLPEKDERDEVVRALHASTQLARAGGGARGRAQSRLHAGRADLGVAS